MSPSRITLALLVAASAFAADKYTGPRPPKADVPYLLHADNLIETEVGKANTDERKDTVVATVPGVILSCEDPAGRTDFPYPNG